jgi:glycosyltransferase involved in cell wall biosynthesis
MKLHTVQLVSSGGFYGAERVMIELATFLKNNGCQSRLAILDSPGASEIEVKAKQAHIEIDIIRGKGLQLLINLQRYFNTHKFDIIHSHGYKTDILVALLSTGRTKTIATCHTWYSQSLKLKVYELLNRVALKFFDYVSVVSPQLYKDVTTGLLKVKRAKMIYNGIALPKPASEQAIASIRHEFGVADDAALVIRLGRLDKYKGNKYLIDAFAQFKKTTQAHLVFVGEGEEKSMLRQQANMLGLDNAISFSGYRTDVTELICAADIFVIPSLNEGLPIALLEAMACAKPIIATKVGAIPEVITHTKNGWLIEPENSHAILNALTDATSNPDHAQVYAQRACSDFTQRFSQNAMGRKYLEIYAWTKSH